jgi:hypothetical protein
MTDPQFTTRAELAKRLRKLSAKAKQGPFKALQPVNIWFVINDDRWKLATCHDEQDAKLIEVLASNLPTIIAALEGRGGRLAHAHLENDDG